MPHKNKTERRMSLYNKSTYTFGMLKQGVYKALDEFSVNGYSVSVAKGIASDIEKRIIAALNMCARRVALRGEAGTPAPADSVWPPPRLQCL